MGDIGFGEAFKAFAIINTAKHEIKIFPISIDFPRAKTQKNLLIVTEHLYTCVRHDKY
jgi:hypothetical protein